MPSDGHVVARWRSWDLPDTTSIADRVRGRRPLLTCDGGAEAPIHPRKGHLEARRNHGCLRPDRSYRDAAELAGCSHYTVKSYVEARAAGGDGFGLDRPVKRPQVIYPFVAKVEVGRIERSKGKVLADKVHAKLVWLGYTGSERTTRGRSRTRVPPTGWGTSGCTGRGSPNRAGRKARRNSCATASQPIGFVEPPERD